MFELYFFIGALLIIVIIVSRRIRIFNSEKQIEFKKKVAQKVDEMQEERKNIQEDRFKDIYVEEQQGKQQNFIQYKESVRRADMAMAQERWNEAKKYLIQALALAKDEVLISLKLAKVYIESEDLRMAEAIYKRLIESGENNYMIFKNLAKINAKKKKYKEAVKFYVQALESNETDDESLVGLGSLYKLLMRHSLAAECFKRAAELKPREVEYLFLLADACAMVDDFDNALFTYERILTIEPYNEKAKNESNDVRVKMKEMEQTMIG